MKSVTALELKLIIGLPNDSLYHSQLAKQRVILVIIQNGEGHYHF